VNIPRPLEEIFRVPSKKPRWRDAPTQIAARRRTAAAADDDDAAETTRCRHIPSSLA
jgi:hypothetical protein